MNGLRTSRRSFACCALAILCSTVGAQVLRAEEPVNPLRRGDDASRVSIAADAAFASDAIPQTSRRDRREDLLPGAGSVVPARFGQPEPLPPGWESEQSAFDPQDHGFIEEDPWSGRLVHRWFAEPWFGHSDPNDPLRHVGLGQPLMGTSWRNRPLFFGLFLGGVLTDDLVSNRVDQNDTAFMGGRLGADFDHYWGVEFRYAFARPQLTTGEGVPIFGDGRDYFADIELVHYPWGDSRWRPYFLAGIGFQTFRFHDHNDQYVSEALLSIPLGAGLKYYWTPWFSLRFDFVDNIAIGNEHVSGMHNIGFMAGGEFRFGGRRQSYFPWHNGTTYW